MKPSPPFFLRLIMMGLLQRDIRHSVIESMDEAYAERRARSNALLVCLWYLAQLLTFIPGSIKNALYWESIMLSNYLKSNYRHIQKSKGFSAINLIGLTIGLTCAMLILIYVRSELSYDRHIYRSEDVYRIFMDQPDNLFMGRTSFTVTPAPLKEAIEASMPEVESVGRMSANVGGLITAGRETFVERNLFMADPEIIDIFDLHLTRGDAHNALRAPYTMIISQGAAEKYFGSTEAVGQKLRKDNTHDFMITGVFENMPPNSHMQFDFLGSFQTLYSPERRRNLESWTNNSYLTYVRARPKTEIATLQRQLDAIKSKHLDSDSKHLYLAESVQNIHLYSNHNFELNSTGDINLLYLFSGIGLFILLIASLNYMNLATARSLNRSREVGMRKVVGALRQHLLFQFLGESLLFSLSGLCLSLVLTAALLPGFSVLMDRNLSVTLAFNPVTLLYIFILTVFLGLISGLYPSIYLSSFKPITIFSGINRKGQNRSRQLRHILVVLQFIISIVLISGTLVMHKQMRFIRNKNLGFEKDQIFTVRLRDPELKKQYHPLQNALAQIPGVTDLTATRQLPITIRSSSTPSWEGKTKDEQLHVYKMHVDYNTLDFFGMSLLQGRHFNKAHPTDAREAILLNEAAVEAIGWKNPLGKEFKFNRKYPKKVIGIVKNFHFSTLHLGIQPVAVELIESDSWTTMQYFALRVQATNLPETVASIKKTVNTFSPIYPADFRFLDDRVEAMYRAEKRLASSFNLFTSIAIGIACLGLLGMASFITEKRAKEMSIRKVLGASTGTITQILTQSFLKWIIIANLLACPIAYFAFKKWLENFSYRINLGPEIFLFSLGISIAMALLTVGYQTIKTARARPADMLRRET